MTKIILRLPSVKIRTGLSRSSIYLRMSENCSENRFPKSISLGGRAVGWLESVINDWLEEQIKQSRPEAGSDHE